jgi:hypothetical protein
MVSLDIESVGPQLKRIKIAQLEPELLAGVLEIAEEHGYEVTITASSDLGFLYQIYKAENARRKKDLKRLKKAQDMIMRLAGAYSLHHATARQEAKSREERRGGFRGASMEYDMEVSKRMRELFNSIGINDEREMERAVSLLGEGKIEERVSEIMRSRLWPEPARSVFGENPETIRMPKDDDFTGELCAMEDKKDILDAWKDATGNQLPVWADYDESPSVLLVEYTVICKVLGIASAEGARMEEDAASERAGPLDRKGLEKTLGELGFRMEREDGGLVFSHEDGRVITITDPGEGKLDARALWKVLGTAGSEPDYERTDPGRPSALARKGRRRPRSGETEGKEVEGLSEMLEALSKRGIDISRLSNELESISEETDAGSRSRERARFGGCISLFFDLIVRRDLESLINESSGSQGLRIGKVRYLVGASGAFELSMVDGNGAHAGRLYLSMQDMEPALIGKEMVEASGMVSHRIWVRGAGGQPFSYEGRRYSLSEDAREVGKRGAMRLRMPDTFMMEEAVAEGAAMFREDLALRPDPADGFHAAFYRSLSDEVARKGIMRSLLSYFEMSRRALLPDRRPPNTFVLRVARQDGKESFLFQPTDMDGIGNFIDSAGGKPDFSEFERDFQKAAVDFAVHLHEGMMRASRRGMVEGDVPSVSRLFWDILGEAQKPFPEDDEAAKSARDGVFRSNGGKMIGIGFDAAGQVGKTIPSLGGRSRIMRSDGRVLLDAERALAAASQAASMDAQRRFFERMGPGGLDIMSGLPERAAGIAMAILEARTLPEGSQEQRRLKAEKLERLSHRTCGEIAMRVADSIGPGGLKAQAARKARDIIFEGSGTAPAEARPPDEDERTRPERAVG